MTRDMRYSGKILRVKGGFNMTHSKGVRTRTYGPFATRPEAVVAALSIGLEVAWRSDDVIYLRAAPLRDAA